MARPQFGQGGLFASGVDLSLVFARIGSIQYISLVLGCFMGEGRLLWLPWWNSSHLNKRSHPLPGAAGPSCLDRGICPFFPSILLCPRNPLNNAAYWLSLCQFEGVVHRGRYMFPVELCRVTGCLWRLKLSGNGSVFPSLNQSTSACDPPLFLKGASESSASKVWWWWLGKQCLHWWLPLLCPH